MTSVPESAPPAGSNKIRQGWLAKCISTLSLRNGDRKTEDDPNRPVVPSSNSTGGKRKRSSPQSIRAKPSFKKETKTTIAQMSNPSQPDDLLKAKLKQAAEYFQSTVNAENVGKAYQRERDELLEQVENHAWDFKAKESISDNEKKAAEIIFKIREYERDVLFGNIASEDLPGEDTLDMGGQFLTNKKRIELDSMIFRIARRVPKGAIQHLHFNAELPPERLLQEAREMTNMFIRSKRALLEKKDLDLAELIFEVAPEDVTPRGDIFSETYKPEGNKVGPYMLWSEFREKFVKNFPGVGEQPAEYRSRYPNRGLDDSSAQGFVALKPAEEWIRSKMVLSEEEAYGRSQTVNGVWARFNQATRCFKGLLNYEKVYEWYISKAIDAMIAEGVMYAELRPMLMDKSIPTTDGKKKVSHDQQMDLIISCVAKKKEELAKAGKAKQFPFGLKIIYCTPRSIPKLKMRSEMQDCINLKIKYPDLICGFDLVGAEDRANHIGYYRDELVAFMKTCKDLNLEIPFMFHAGETLLDTGGSKDPANSNLYEAVLLNSKRIGHGFALMKHPKLVEKFRGDHTRPPICIELCPISNELLHLCRNIKEHPFPELLAAGIPCTVNSDNPSLFSNSMSHEFYQVMVGSPAMTVHSWKQLALWSLEYSCLKKHEIDEAIKIFKDEWEIFCEWVVDEYKGIADKLDENGKPTQGNEHLLQRKLST